MRGNLSPVAGQIGRPDDPGVRPELGDAHLRCGPVSPAGQVFVEGGLGPLQQQVAGIGYAAGDDEHARIEDRGQ